MNRFLIAAVAAMGLTAAGAPALAQAPANSSAVVVEYGFGPAFWRGAPEPVAERLGWLDMRVENGIREGTITRAEAARVHRMLRRTRAVNAQLLTQDGGTLTRRDSSYMQRRLDNMSAQIHWAHTNGVDRHTPI